MTITLKKITDFPNLLCLILTILYGLIGLIVPLVKESSTKTENNPYDRTTLQVSERD
ncbi:unnamed protein product [Rhizopus stolonifer]